MQQSQGLQPRRNKNKNIEEDQLHRVLESYQNLMKLSVMMTNLNSEEFFIVFTSSENLIIKIVTKCNSRLNSR